MPIERPVFFTYRDSVLQSGYNISYHNPETRKDIDNADYQELCEIAVQKAAEAIRYIKFKFITNPEAIMLPVVEKYEFALQYIPAEYLTQKVCQVAVDNFPYALAFVPKEMQTVEMCYYAMKAKPYVAKYALVDHKLIVEYNPLEALIRRVSPDKSVKLAVATDVVVEASASLVEPTAIVLNSSEPAPVTEVTEVTEVNKVTEATKVTEVAVKVCTSEILMDILKAKQYTRITEYTSFDLDDKAIDELCRKNRFCSDDKIDFCYIIKNFASSEILEKMINIVYIKKTFDYYKMAERLIKCGIDLDRPIDENGLRPLHYAVKCNGNLSTRDLLEYKVRTDIPDNFGMLPIHYVNSNSVLEQFLNFNIALDGKNKDGNTFLHMCCISEEPAIDIAFSKAVKSGRIDLDITNNENKTALDILCSTNDSNRFPRNKIMIKTLLNNKASVGNAFNYLYNNTTITVDMLLGWMRDICYTIDTNLLINTVFNPTVKENATIDERIKMIDGFAKYISINYEPADKLTALHLACKESNIDLVKCMLQLGANRNLCDANGSKPIWHAVEAKNIDIVQLLI
jgi:ankyrin repeat protein